jgi:Holliday junction resolvase
VLSNYEQVNLRKSNRKFLTINTINNFWSIKIMGSFSKNKGKRGERELARELSRVLGVRAWRGVQFQGSPDSPDIAIDIPDIHIECKRAERFNLYKSLEQAEADSCATQIPIVLHRQNKKAWVAVIKLDDLPRLSRIIVTNNHHHKLIDASGCLKR